LPAAAAAAAPVPASYQPASHALYLGSKAKPQDYSSLIVFQSFFSNVSRRRRRRKIVCESFFFFYSREEK
jgi:hypothetical protein